MKKLSFFLAVCLSFPAIAESGFYFGLKGGVTAARDTGINTDVNYSIKTDTTTTSSWTEDHWWWGSSKTHTSTSTTSVIKNGIAYIIPEYVLSLIPAATVSFGYDFFIPFEFPMRIELEYSKKFLTSRKIEGEWTKTGGSLDGEETTAPEVIAKLEQSIRTSHNFLMANVYYDWYNGSPYVPYVLAGYGYTINDFIYEDQYGKVREIYNRPAWQVGIGAIYLINDYMLFDISLKYVNLGQMRTTKTHYFNVNQSNTNIDSIYALRFQDSIDTLDLSFGIRFTF